MTGPRVLLLSNFPVPYQLELIRAVDAAGELELHPRFLAPRDPGRGWPSGESERARVLPALGTFLPPELRLHPTLLREARALRPELAIVCGYSYATFQAALVGLAALGVPSLLWAEEPRLDQGGPVRRLTRRALLQSVRLTRGVLAVGSRAAQVWQRLLPRASVANFPYVCELDRYLTLSRPARETFTILFCGQLVERKGVDLLIHAFSDAARRDPRLRLLLAGEGPLRAQSQAMVPPELRARVEWAGFVPWERLPELYARADALAVPSRHDGWALVVNEAFAAGLPVVATDAVGAAIDLIAPGETGLLVPAGEIAPLAEALSSLPPRARAMGARAREVARARLLPSQAAARLAQLVRAALAGEARS